jgi:UDP-N-acetyl-D-glucosamine dehydrogenase
VVAKVFEALNRHRKSVNGARILILGVAYKRDIDDVRESPAADVIRGLSARGAELCYHDPHVPELHVHSLDLTSVPLTDELLQGLDCAVIVTDHSEVDYRRVVSRVSVVVDARNATAGFRDLGDVITI